MRKSLLVGCVAILLVGLCSTATHAEDGAVLAGYDCRSDPFSPGVRLFNNRSYVLATPPESLAGMTFLRTSIDGVSFQCLKPGVLYALSPTPGRKRAADQETALLAAGFDKLDEPEFQLYGGDAINRVSIYRKEVAAGEELSFGKWVLMLGPGLTCQDPEAEPWSENDGELLYNGILLPKQWPPRHLDPFSRKPMPVPYLQSPPDVIRIDVGRQLFVDDFLIESTTLKREFHKAKKFAGNPVLAPETELEMNGGHSPMACPFSDGVFYDPKTSSSRSGITPAFSMARLTRRAWTGSIGIAPISTWCRERIGSSRPERTSDATGSRSGLTRKPSGPMNASRCSCMSEAAPTPPAGDF